MAGRKVVWQKHQCAQADTMWVDQSSVDDKGKALGRMDVSHGALSVTYTKMSNDRLCVTTDMGLNPPMCDTYGVTLKAWGFMPPDNNTNKGITGEVNWTYTANIVPKTDGGMESRLTHQRHDGICSSPCEGVKGYNTEFQFTPEDTLQIDCTWSLSASIPDGLITCTILKVNAVQKYTLETSMGGGPYSLMNYIAVGKKAYPEGPYPGFDSQVSDFVVTIFETPK
jgi:hypothetical protein